MVSGEKYCCLIWRRINKFDLHWCIWTYVIWPFKDVSALWMYECFRMDFRSGYTLCLTALLIVEDKFAYIIFFYWRPHKKPAFVWFLILYELIRNIILMGTNECFEDDIMANMLLSDSFIGLFWSKVQQAAIQERSKFMSHLLKNNVCAKESIL